MSEVVQLAIVVGVCAIAGLVIAALISFFAGR